jgi:hypothetical protein
MLKFLRTTTSCLSAQFSLVMMGRNLRAHSVVILSARISRTVRSEAMRYSDRIDDRDRIVDCDQMCAGNEITGCPDPEIMMAKESVIATKSAVESVMVRELRQ